MKLFQNISVMYTQSTRFESPPLLKTFPARTIPQYKYLLVQNMSIHFKRLTC